MLGNIGPVGYGGEGQTRYWRSAALLHLVGNGVGGACIGATCGALGLWLGSRSAAFAALPMGVLSTVYSLSELEIVRLPYPQFRRQVPARWRFTMGPRRRSLLYGLQLGAAITTHIGTGAVYVLLLGLVLLGDPLFGAACMSLYGISRAVPVLVGDWRARQAANAFEIVVPLARLEGHARAVAGTVLALVGGYLVALWASTAGGSVRPWGG